MGLSKLSMRKIDPFYYLLRFILRSFSKKELTPTDEQAILDNIDKHRKVQWVNLFFSGLVIFGLFQTNNEQIGNLINVLIAPVMVMGGAWFGISFGGIPEKMLDVALETTFWMFCAFLISLSTMFIAIFFITPLMLWPVFGMIYLSAVVSCIIYDTADSLKIGLDEYALRHSRAALRYYKQKEGISED